MSIAPPTATHPDAIAKIAAAAAIQGISERTENGLLILSPTHQKPIRRILFTNVSGGPQGWTKVKDGSMPSHRLWGVPELVRLGYEVGFVPSLPDFYFGRKALPHDLSFYRHVRNWLGPDDIVYCAHNKLYWIPFLKSIGLVKPRIVSLLYAREPLNHAKAHAGVIALTPAAAEQARKLAPNAKVDHLGWGVHLPFYPSFPFTGEFLVSCGRTHRDDKTLKAAASKSRAPITLIQHASDGSEGWSENVRIIQGGPGWESRLSYPRLFSEYFAPASGFLIIVDPDPTEETACGFTNMIEAMVMARPVILTRTSALKTEINVESAGIGIHVEPGDANSLAEAMSALTSDPERGRRMGMKARHYAETHYNIDRFASGLHKFFLNL